MRFPRVHFTVRTMMVGVGLVALSIAGARAIKDYRKCIHVVLVNRIGEPMREVTVHYPEGEQTLASLPPGGTARWHFRTRVGHPVHVSYEVTRPVPPPPYRGLTSTPYSYAVFSAPAEGKEVWVAFGPGRRSLPAPVHMYFR